MTTSQCYPATSDRWSDLEGLFGNSGANAGCWCMFWRLERAMFKKTKGEANRQILKQIVNADEQPGVLAYDGKQVVGWCGIAPREKLIALENSRILKRVDDQPVWSITCFFVAKEVRGKGVMRSLLKAAVDHAKSHGAQIVEPTQSICSLQNSWDRRSMAIVVIWAWHPCFVFLALQRSVRLQKHNLSCGWISKAHRKGNQSEVYIGDSHP